VPVQAGEFIQHSHHVLCLAAPGHPDLQAEAAVLVDHVQELEPAPIGGGVELKVHGLDLVGMLGQVTPHCPVGRPCSLSLLWIGPLQAFLPQEPLHPLVIHGQALTLQQAVGHPAAPADVPRTKWCA
jgi:hypothetical protein